MRDTEIRLITEIINIKIKNNYYHFDDKKKTKTKYLLSIFFFLSVSVPVKLVTAFRLC